MICGLGIKSTVRFKSEVRVKKLWPTQDNLLAKARHQLKEAERRLWRRQDSKFHMQLAGGKLTISRDLSFPKRKRYSRSAVLNHVCDPLRFLIKNS